MIINIYSQYYVHVCYGAGEDIVFMATDIELLGNVDWVMLQSCFDAHFLLVLEKQDLSHSGAQMFFAIVQLIGTNKQADSFIYRYHIQHCYSFFQ